MFLKRLECTLHQRHWKPEQVSLRGSELDLGLDLLSIIIQYIHVYTCVSFLLLTSLIRDFFIDFVLDNRKNMRRPLGPCFPIFATEVVLDHGHVNHWCIGFSLCSAIKSSRSHVSPRLRGWNSCSAKGSHRSTQTNYTSIVVRTSMFTD